MLPNSLQIMRYDLIFNKILCYKCHFGRIFDIRITRLLFVLAPLMLGLGIS